MPPLTIWAIIVTLAIGTFGLRLSFILLFGRIRTMPSIVDRSLTFVPMAVLAALVFPALIYTDGQIVVGLANRQLLAGLAAGVAAWRTESMLVTILVGMATLWVLTIGFP